MFVSFAWSYTFLSLVMCPSPKVTVCHATGSHQLSLKIEFSGGVNRVKTAFAFTSQSCDWQPEKIEFAVDRSSWAKRTWESVFHVCLIVFHFTHHYCPLAIKHFQLINTNDPSRSHRHDFHKDWSFSVAQAHDTCKRIRQLRSCPQGIIWGFLTSVFIQLQQSQEWSIWWLSNGIYGFVS